MLLDSSSMKTSFPKISGKHQDFVSQLRRLRNKGSLPQVMDVEGTVKLHGMHADIVFELNDTAKTKEDSLCGITFQSRNRTCGPQESQHGWPRDLARYPEALHYIKSRVLDTFHDKNPGQSLDRSYPLIIAGEWIGERVQSRVGIAALSTRFVILTIQINGVWQRDVDYRDVQASRAGIYNVHLCGNLTLKLDTSDLSDNNPTLIEMQKHADDVERACPFAAVCGIPNSPGEGVVWKPGTREGRANAKCWLKTKGPICGAENRIDVARIAADQARNLSVTEAVERWLSPRRIEQGFEYLLEMDMDPTRESLKCYIGWLTLDIMTEEEGEVEALEKKHLNASKTIKEHIESAAKAAYLKSMRKCGIRLAWATWLDRPSMGSTYGH